MQSTELILEKKQTKNKAANDKELDPCGTMKTVAHSEKMNNRIHITVMKLAPGRERRLHTHTGQLDHDELIMPCMEEFDNFQLFDLTKSS